MQPLQALKYLSAIAPGAILDDTAATSIVVGWDEHGADVCRFVLHCGATDIAAAVYRVMESDTLTNSTTLGGSPSAVITPSAAPDADSDGNLWSIEVHRTGARKRYLQLQYTAGDGSNGSYVSAIAILGRLNEAPATAAARGFEGEDIVLS